MTDNRKLVVGKDHGYPHPVVIRGTEGHDGPVKVADVFHSASYDAKETAEEMVRRWNCHNQLVEVCKNAQCDCSPKERLSGHKVGCWFPDLQEALAAAQKERQA